MSASPAAAVGCTGAFGGRSSMPLRPQPARASATAIRTRAAHLEDAGLVVRFTAISLQCGGTIQRLRRSGEGLAGQETTEPEKNLWRNSRLSPISALFPAA